MKYIVSLLCLLAVTIMPNIVYAEVDVENITYIFNLGNRNSGEKPTTPSSCVPNGSSAAGTCCAGLNRCDDGFCRPSCGTSCENEPVCYDCHEKVRENGCVVNCIDSCPDGQYCTENGCVCDDENLFVLGNKCVECRNNGDCKDPKPYCKSDSNTCVECLEHEDCGTDTLCENNICNPCPTDRYRVGDECVCKTGLEDENGDCVECIMDADCGGDDDCYYCKGNSCHYDYSCDEGGCNGCLKKVTINGQTRTECVDDPDCDPLTQEEDNCECVDKETPVYCVGQSDGTSCGSGVCCGGSCVSKCTSDDSCGEGQKCDSTGCCVSNKCEDGGDYCEGYGQVCCDGGCADKCTDGSCGEGLKCDERGCCVSNRCEDGGDYCEAGKSCCDGNCQQPCTSTSCDTGYECSNGCCHLGTEKCGSGASKPECSSDGDCSADYECENGCCVQGCGSATPCPNGNECSEGETCSNGCCAGTPCESGGTYCEAGQSCCSGSCQTTCTSDESCDMDYKCENGCCVAMTCAEGAIYCDQGYCCGSECCPEGHACADRLNY